MSKRSGNSTVWLLLAVFVVAVGILWWKPWKSLVSGGDPEPPLTPEITKLVEDARRFHGQGEWCTAAPAWQKVVDMIGNQSGHEAIRREAVGNLDIAKAKCQPTHPPVEAIELKPPQTLPRKVPEDEIARFYNVGKTVRSVAYLMVTGKGTNQNWILKGTANFAYQYRIIVETKVVENRGATVVFEQHYQDVSQLRAESKKELELSPPSSPILALVWDEIERNLLITIPPYLLIKRATELVEISDPRLKKTLTRFYKTLKHQGGPLVPDGGEDMALVEKISDLTGQRVRIEYQSGLGVTEIKVLDGKTLPPDDLERLAYGSSLLMDYFLGESATHAKSGPFTVSMADLGGLFGLFNYKTSGELEFKKSATGDRNGEQVDILEVVGGAVAVDDANANRMNRITPRPGGFVHYSEHKRLVRQAQIAWHADAHWFTQDSLLFGTENLRDATMETYYEADVVEPGKE